MSQSDLSDSEQVSSLYRCECLFSLFSVAVVVKR